LTFLTFLFVAAEILLSPVVLFICDVERKDRLLKQRFFFTSKAAYKNNANVQSFALSATTWHSTTGLQCGKLVLLTLFSMHPDSSPSKRNAFHASLLPKQAIHIRQRLYLFFRYTCITTLCHDH